MIPSWNGTHAWPDLHTVIDIACHANAATVDTITQYKWLVSHALMQPEMSMAGDLPAFPNWTRDIKYTARTVMDLAPSGLMWTVLWFLSAHYGIRPGQSSNCWVRDLGFAYMNCTLIFAWPLWCQTWPIQKLMGPRTLFIYLFILNCYSGLC